MLAGSWGRLRSDEIAEQFSLRIARGRMDKGSPVCFSLTLPAAVLCREEWQPAGPGPLFSRPLSTRGGLAFLSPLLRRDSGPRCVPGPSVDSLGGRRSRPL